MENNEGHIGLFYFSSPFFGKGIYRFVQIYDSRPNCNQSRSRGMIESQSRAACIEKSKIHDCITIFHHSRYHQDCNDHACTFSVKREREGDGESEFLQSSSFK